MVADDPAKLTTATPQPQAAVRAANLTYGYRRGHPVIEDLTTEVNPGSMMAITGRSGRGKSTLLYLFAGLLTPWAGEVYVEGRNQTGRLDAELARLRAQKFGFVFQDVVLDPRRTIMDAVLEPCLYAGEPRKRYRDRAAELLDTLGVRLQASSRPGEISGGQAQRVGVCRAMLMSPVVIFADEPTGNLDAESADAVISALERAAKDGCAILIATHDERVVERCTERVVLT